MAGWKVERSGSGEEDVGESSEESTSSSAVSAYRETTKRDARRKGA